MEAVDGKADKDSTKDAIPVAIGSGWFFINPRLTLRPLFHCTEAKENSLGVKEAPLYLSHLCLYDLSLLRPSSYAAFLPQRIKLRRLKKFKCQLNAAEIRRLKPNKNLLI